MSKYTEYKIGNFILKVRPIQVGDCIYYVPSHIIRLHNHNQWVVKYRQHLGDKTYTFSDSKYGSTDNAVEQAVLKLEEVFKANPRARYHTRVGDKDNSYKNKKSPLPDGLSFTVKPCNNCSLYNVSINVSLPMFKSNNTFKTVWVIHTNPFFKPDTDQKKLKSSIQLCMAIRKIAVDNYEKMVVEKIDLVDEKMRKRIDTLSYKMKVENKMIREGIKYIRQQIKSK